MNKVTTVDPRDLFARLVRELPAQVLERVYVVGSLAGAYHHVDRLAGRGVKTKDADLVIHPARDVTPAEEIARQLMERGWRPKPDGERAPGTAATPATELPAIRLYPPEHDDYFIEILIVPAGEDAGAKPWISVELADGWYGVPSFEFLSLTLIDRQRSSAGIEYAHPSMMALANLLSHPTLGNHVMSTPVDDRRIHRASKDLGRVLALARLESRDELETWVPRWRVALAQCFPTRNTRLAAQLGAGLRALLDDGDRFDEAWHCCTVGLLATMGVSHEQLRAIALQLLVDVIEPVEASAR